MTVGHQVARAFPTTNVPGRNCPSRTSQVSFACEKFKVNRRAEKRVSIYPFRDLSKFLDGHRAGEEEIFRAQLEPFDHIPFGSVVVVAGSDGVSVNPKI